MPNELDSKVFLLPLSETEVASLIVAVTLVLTSIDAAEYTNELQKQVAMAQKSSLSSIQEKLTQRR